MCDQNKSETIQFPNRFSQIVIVDKILDNKENNKDINNFLNHRVKSTIDIREYNNEYIFINQSNASRCFYNFYTSKINYILMSEICFSLTHLNKNFYKIFYETKLPIKFISIHFRFGDVSWSSDHINNSSNNNTNNIEKIIDDINPNILPILIMCDRKDANIP